MLASHDTDAPQMNVRRSRRRVLAALALAVLALLAATIGALAAMTALQAAFFPYNGEGRYFDGLVVHHDGAQFVYAAIAFGAWAMAGCAGYFAYRLARPAAAARSQQVSCGPV